MRFKTKNIFPIKQNINQRKKLSIKIVLTFADCMKN